MQTIFPGRSRRERPVPGIFTPPVSGSSNRRSDNRSTSLRHRIEPYELPRDLIPMYKDTPCRWQSLHQRLAVRLGDEARVGDDDCTPVGFRSDQAAEALLQSERGMRHHVFSKRVAAALRYRLTMSGCEWLGGN